MPQRKGKPLRAILDPDTHWHQCRACGDKGPCNYTLCQFPGADRECTACYWARIDMEKEAG